MKIIYKVAITMSAAAGLILVLAAYTYVQSDETSVKFNILEDNFLQEMKLSSKLYRTIKRETNKISKEMSVGLKTKKLPDGFEGDVNKSFSTIESGVELIIPYIDKRVSNIDALIKQRQESLFSNSGSSLLYYFNKTNEINKLSRRRVSLSATKDIINTNIKIISDIKSAAKDNVLLMSDLSKAYADLSVHIDIEDELSKTQIRSFIVKSSKLGNDNKSLVFDGFLASLVSAGKITEAEAVASKKAMQRYGQKLLNYQDIEAEYIDNISFFIDQSVVFGNLIGNWKNNSETELNKYIVEVRKDIKSSNKVAVIMSIFVFLIIVIVSILTAVSIGKNLMPLQKRLRELNESDEIDLNKRITLNTNDETAAIAYQVDSFLQKIFTIINDISSKITTTLEGNRHISVRINKAAEMTEENESNLEFLKGSFDEVKEGSEVIYKRINGLRKEVEEAEKIARVGHETLIRGRDFNDSVKGKIEIGSETIKRLGGSVNEIYNLINVVNEIAQATELLAVNAAMAANKATVNSKEQKGTNYAVFGVVSKNINRLAEKIGKATVEIGDYIDNIRAETNEAIDIMGDIQDSIVETTRNSVDTIDDFKVLIKQIEYVLEDSTDINAAAEEQTGAIKEIETQLLQVVNNTKSISNDTRGISITTSEANETAMEIETILSIFNRINGVEAEVVAEEEVDIEEGSRDGWKNE